MSTLTWRSLIALLILVAVLPATASAQGGPLDPVSLTVESPDVLLGTDAAETRILLANSRALATTVDLVVVDGPAWASAFTPANISVPGGGSSNVTFRVAPPTDTPASTGGTFTVRGNENGGATNTGTFTVTLQPSSFTLGAPAGRSVDAGDVVDVPFTFANNGWLTDLDLRADSSGWSSTLDRTQLRLPKEGAGAASMQVSVPAGASAGPREVVLIATSHDGIERRATAILDVNASPAGDPGVESPPPERPVDDGNVTPKDGSGGEESTGSPPSGASANESTGATGSSGNATSPDEPPAPTGAPNGDVEAANDPGLIGGSIPASPSPVPRSRVITDQPVTGTMLIGIVGGVAGLAAAPVAVHAWMMRGRMPSRLGGLAALFTRLTAPKVLSHAARRDLRERIRNEPGIRYRELARETDLAFGVLTYHLGVLERNHFIVARREPGTVRYYEPGHAPAAGSPLGDVERALVELVAREGSIRLADAARHVGRDRRDLHRRLPGLVEAGHLATRKEGRAVFIEPATAGRSPEPRPLTGMR